MDELVELLGESPAIEVVRDKLRRLLARQRAGQRLPPVLLQADTGAGKGLVARLLHRHGARRQAPFVDVNCAAIPETLLEAELFGFEPGAFTDARRAKRGLFQAAHRGVLFLDEVSLLSDAAQAKLLTAIEERAIRPLGSTRAEPADAWVISATNSDLRAAVAARRFRSDLYHRLAVLTIDLPPLQARGRDILLLAEHFVTRACAEYGLPPLRLDAAARARLLAYSWPGNVRELGNVIERAVLFCETPMVTAAALGPLETEAAATAGAASPAGSTSTRDEAMRRHLLVALEETQWNVSLTAARLGIARNTVYARLEKFGMRSTPSRQVAAGSSEPVTTAVEPPPPDSGLEWEPRRLALLRADLASTDRLDAWSQASRALDAVITKVQSFGGRVEELTPTSLIAVFGVDSVEDAPRRAAHVALAIQRGVQRARERGESVPGTTISLHVAPLLIGRFGPRVEIDGAALRAELPILGQLLRAREAGETVASSAAAPFLERRFELVGLGTIAEGDLSAYRLTGEERRGLGLWGRMTRFVGRANDLEALRSRMALAAGGHGQVVAVVGDAGVGKSRLIYEFGAAQRLAGYRVLEGASVSYGRALSYGPVIDFLKAYFTIHDQDDTRRVRDKVTGKLLSLDPSLASTLPAVLALFDVSMDDPTWRTLEPAQRRQRTHDAVRRLILREARAQPILVVFEDLHWIDSETQSVLDGVVNSLPSARLLLLVSYRPEYQHAWSSKTCFSQLGIASLSPGSVEEFLDALLGHDVGLRSLKQLLVRRGNPFFLEETVRTLAETRALVGEPGAYRLAQPVHAVQIPPTVQVILEARIDRLSPEDKRLLEAASVIGKDVPVALLAAITEIGETALLAGLARLHAAEFLYEVQPPRQAEYTFKHALTHDVAYAGLLKERRREIHGRVVAAIEALHPDRQGEQIERLAHHALHGELREKAVRYLRQAGRKAAARSALRDAVVWFEHALGALLTLPEDTTTLEEAFEIRLEMRPVLSQLSDAQQVLAHLCEAATIAGRLNDDLRRGRVYAVMTLTHTHLGELDEALVSATEALQIARRLGDLKLRLVAQTYLEQAYYYRNDFERAAGLAADNLAALPHDWIYESPSTAAPLSIQDRIWLLGGLPELGRFAEALSYEAEGLRIAAATQHAYTLAAASFNSGKAYMLRGEWERARLLVEHGVSEYRSGGITIGFADVVAHSSWILAQLGAAEEALARLREGEALIERDVAQGIVFQCVPTYRALGRAALLLGRLDEARRLSECALRYSERQPGFSAHTLHLIGDIATHPDLFDPQSGKAYYERALALAEPLGMRPLVAHCHLGLGKLYRRTGSRELAGEHLGSATAMYREMGMQFWLEQAEAEAEWLR
jgi:transcriptional regulator with AAA-type ATPase domain/tetratricopeptide (TPR) repeat protein